MLFRRKEDRDLGEIKEAMEQPMEEIPTAPAPQRTAQQMHGELGAPLFVKVEKYREVLTTLQEVKLFTAGVRQLLGILHEVEAIRSDATNIMRATVERLDRAITEIDSDLLRPRGVTLMDYDRTTTEIGQVEHALTELQGQLGDLRRQLQGLR
jgi:hypothetical protein